MAQFLAYLLVGAPFVGIIVVIIADFTGYNKKHDRY
jgi:hypothetical protein